MAKKKKSTMQNQAGDAAKKMLQQASQLEKQYLKLAGAATAAAGHDDRIKAIAIKRHDAIQKQIAALEPKLMAMLPDTDPELAKRYARLLQERKKYHAIILRHRSGFNERTVEPLA